MSSSRSRTERLAGSICTTGRPRRRCWQRLAAAGEKGRMPVCLVTGARAPVARLHPAIKGVWGAPDRPAPRSSRSTSTPSNPMATNRATTRPSPRPRPSPTPTALNRFLERVAAIASRSATPRPCSGPDAGRGGRRMAEAIFGVHVRRRRQAPSTRRPKRRRSARSSRRSASGRPLARCRSGPGEGVRFHVLGLAPNAARHLDPLLAGERFRRARRQLSALSSPTCGSSPARRDGTPPLWRYLLETAVLGQARKRAAQSRRRVDARDPLRHALSAHAAFDRAHAHARGRTAEVGIAACARRC